MRNDGSDGTSGLSSVFLLDDLGTARLPEAVQFTNLARCERRRHRRGAIRLIRHIRSIRPPFVCGAGPLGCGIYDGGGVRMHRDRADPPDPSPTGLTGQRNEPGSWFNGLRDARASRGRSPKNTRDRTPPSEPSPRTEQIRDHRRNRCSKSASGLCCLSGGLR